MFQTKYLLIALVVSGVAGGIVGITPYIEAETQDSASSPAGSDQKDEPIQLSIEPISFTEDRSSRSERVTYDIGLNVRLVGTASVQVTTYLTDHRGNVMTSVNTEPARELEKVSTHVQQFQTPKNLDDGLYTLHARASLLGKLEHKGDDDFQWFDQATYFKVTKGHIEMLTDEEWYQHPETMEAVLITDVKEAI